MFAHSSGNYYKLWYEEDMTFEKVKQQEQEERTMNSVDTTLDERGKRYGTFLGHAKITQALKAAMVAAPNWATLDDDMKEALEMIAHKMGRILNGDPMYIDSWHDLVGYAKLVEDRLNGKVR